MKKLKIITASFLCLGLAACGSSDRIENDYTYTQQTTPSLLSDPTPTSILVHFQKKPNNPAGIDFIESKNISSFIRSNIPWTETTVTISGPDISNPRNGVSANVNQTRMSNLVRICELNGTAPNRIKKEYSKEWKITISN